LQPKREQIAVYRAIKALLQAVFTLLDPCLLTPLLPRRNITFRSHCRRPMTGFAVRFCLNLNRHSEL